MDIVERLLNIAEWSGVAVLLFLLYRIAYFYEVSAKQSTHYRLFLAPLVLMLAGGVRYAMAPAVKGDLIGDGLVMTGGIMLFLLGLLLVREMTGGRR
jgi:uncharacterized membrane protein HdeD (DUF308 family)